jgi:hypothetical protein
MAILKNPALFSGVFGVDPDIFRDAGLLDPILNVDTKLFIDPLLLRDSSNPTIADEGIKQLRDRFQKILKLVLRSKSHGDAAWKAAARLLDLDERRETCLGYGTTGVSGSSRSDALKEKILITSKQIIDIGVDDPELISLMGFLEDGVGPDTISDMTTNAIFTALASVTYDFCSAHKIPMKEWEHAGTKYVLPENSFGKKPEPILLVPSDILRDLPIAVDMSDVARVAFHNQKIREKVNSLIADFAHATIADKKKALKNAVLQSAEDFMDVFSGLLDLPEKSYSTDYDKDGIYTFRKVIASVAKQFPHKLTKPSAKNQVSLVALVSEIIDQFKFLIEKNNLNELLWFKDQPRRERAAQLVFFAVADAYCKANNIDISPETNSGGGPVDFKFSSGYRGRCLVEIKLSTGKVVSGYKTQLDVYKDAADTTDGFLLVVNVGKLGSKLKDIQKIQAERRKAGEKVSEIRFVDAGRLPSASHR